MLTVFLGYLDEGGRWIPGGGQGSGVRTSPPVISMPTACQELLSKSLQNALISKNITACLGPIPLLIGGLPVIKHAHAFNWVPSFF
jgi:hypothetical protein